MKVARCCSTEHFADWPLADPSFHVVQVRVYLQDSTTVSWRPPPPGRADGGVEEGYNSVSLVTVRCALGDGQSVGRRRPVGAYLLVPAVLAKPQRASTSTLP